MVKSGSHYHHIKKQQQFLKQQELRSSFFSLVLSIGLIVLSYMLEKSNPPLAKIIAITGSVTLGTCIGIILNGISKASEKESIAHMIEVAFTSHLHAPDESLEPYRKVWHHYHISENNGETFWRYNIFDCSLQIPNKLVAQYSTISPNNNKKRSFSVEGFVLHDKLVFVGRIIGGTEKPFIEIFPRASEDFRENMIGISYLQTFDENEIASPVVLSDHKLELGVKYDLGTVPNEAMEVLSKKWNSQAKRLGLIPHDIKAKA